MLSLMLVNENYRIVVVIVIVIIVMNTCIICSYLEHNSCFVCIFQIQNCPAHFKRNVLPLAQYIIMIYADAQVVQRNHYTQ